MLHKPLHEYNKAGSSLLLPALAPTLVIDCRSLAIPILQPQFLQAVPPVCA